MESDNLLEYEQAILLSDLFDELYFPWTQEKVKEFLSECGLISIQTYGLWVCELDEVSYLRIDNIHKLMLAKIKYGF